MHSLTKLFRIAIAVIVFLAIGSLLNHNASSAGAKSTAPSRGYYLTTGFYDGSQALAACTVGYHMASLWEIHEPSNLRYDTTLGATRGDSGSGPPSLAGWIRTGDLAEPGGNCTAWTSNNFGYGTLVVLATPGTGATSESPWGCVFSIPVPTPPPFGAFKTRTRNCGIV